MPKIVQYQPNQVDSQVVGQPTASPNAGNALFDAQRSVAQSVTNLATEGLKLKGRVDTTSAEEALVQFNRDKNDLFYNADTGYFNTKGRDALDQSKDTNLALDELKIRHAESLNPDAAAMFSKVADRHITRGQADIMKHSTNQTTAYELATFGAQAENSIENASLVWSDEVDLKAQNILGRTAVGDAAKLRGVDGDALKEEFQTFDSAFYGGTITAATQSSAADGKAMMDKYGDRLEGPMKVKLDKQIETKTRTEKIKADAVQAELTSVRLNNEYDDRADMMVEVDKIKDQELQAKTRSATNARFSRDKQAKGEERSANYYEAEDFLMGKGQTPPGQLETWKANNTEAWDSLTKSQQLTLQKIEKGDAAGDDMVLFSDLILGKYGELKNIDPSDYVNQLSKANYKTLTLHVKTAKGKSSPKDQIEARLGESITRQTSAAIEQVIGPQPSKRNAKKRKVWKEQANAFYELVGSEVDRKATALGRTLTNPEYTDIIQGFATEYHEQRSFMGIDSLRRDLTVGLDDVPVANVESLSTFLRETGQEVTGANLAAIQLEAGGDMEAEISLDDLVSKHIPADDITTITTWLTDKGYSATPANILKTYQRAQK